MEIAQLIGQDNSLQRYGLLVERCPDGSLRANVPHVAHHSPSGYECGYAGSGPADLALSVLHALIPPKSEEEEKAIFDLPNPEFVKLLDDPAYQSERIGPNKVRVSNLAYLLHQEFKNEFIATMPKEGGHIPIDVIVSWIEKHKSQV